MSEPRISPTAGPYPNTGQPQLAEVAARPPRWRDIQFVEFEPVEERVPDPVIIAPEPIRAVVVPLVVVSAAPPAPAAANSNEPLRAPALPRGVAFAQVERKPEPEPERAPDLRPQPRVPRYGRAIAPLPPHLIASVLPPPRSSLPPASVRLRPTPPSLGGNALRGTPFGPRRAGRGSRVATLVLIAAAAALIVYRGDLVSGFAASSNPLAPPASVAPLPQTVAAMVPVAATPAADPAPAPSPAPASDRVAALLAQAKAGDNGAQYDLGVLYARGDGVARDYPASAQWFREAAINGNTAAQYNLAVLYERGLGLPQNMNEALIWYHSAAARNYPAAQYNLALSYAEGRGTPQDMVAAARWYKRAAEQGVVAAMVNFAILCEGGQGTERSAPAAYAWYHAAATRGDESAAKRADELYRQFFGDDKAAADAAAAAAAESIREKLLAPAGAAKPGSAGIISAQASG